MSPNLQHPGSARSADVVNEDIRALLERTRRQLSAVERAEFDGLVEEYAEAWRAEVVKAA